MGASWIFKVEYTFCFYISRSKFLSLSRFLFPLVASPPVENMRSTGAVDAGVDKTSQVTRAKFGKFISLS